MQIRTWVWLENLPIKDVELYQLLKKIGRYCYSWKLFLPWPPRRLETQT